MTYTKVVVNTTNGLTLPFNLNQIDRGWVAQILNGTFGSNRDYNFTGNTVTSMSEKQIDINMRLTPAVPIPERSARYYLDYLSSPRIYTVQITNPGMVVPVVRYTKNETTTYTKPTISYSPVNSFSQACVIRELKYNYSESPATIEFTISTKLPIMYGYSFILYFGLGNQNWYQALSDFISTVQNLAPNIGPVDLRQLKLSLPAIGNQKYKIFDDAIEELFGATIQGNSTTNPGVFTMNGLIDGTRRFSIEGGYDANSAACVSYQAYPAFDIRDLSSWLRGLKTPPKIKLDDVGNGYAKFEFVMVRKGL